jgi:hypothetical protein
MVGQRHNAPSLEKLQCQRIQEKTRGRKGLKSEVRYEVNEESAGEGLGAPSAWTGQSKDH